MPSRTPPDGTVASGRTAGHAPALPRVPRRVPRRQGLPVVRLGRPRPRRGGAVRQRLPRRAVPVGGPDHAARRLCRVNSPHPEIQEESNRAMRIATTPAAAPVPSPMPGTRNGLDVGSRESTRSRLRTSKPLASEPPSAGGRSPMANSCGAFRVWLCRYERAPSRRSCVNAAIVGADFDSVEAAFDQEVGEQAATAPDVGPIEVDVGRDEPGSVLRPNQVGSYVQAQEEPPVQVIKTTLDEIPLPRSGVDIGGLRNVGLVGQTPPAPNPEPATRPAGRMPREDCLEGNRHTMRKPAILARM